MAEAGVVTLVPNFLRQQPTYDPRRISDLRDAIEFLEGLEYVDPQRLGIITASFSVETGLMAILDKPNVIADVMISGQILREDSGWDWSEKEDIKRYFKDQVTCCLQFEYVIEKCTNEKALVSN